MLPAEFAESLDRAGARVRRFRDRIQWFDTVASTNDVAAALAERGAEEGTVVAADAQRAGRGRQGRTWTSPPGAGLYVSLVLRPPPAAVRLITLATGVAIADGVEAATGLRPSLKWPNDVYIGNRKAAGVLAEASGEVVVVGFGINVLPAAYPADVASRATSIEAELGRPVGRGLIFAECLAAFASRYDALVAGDAAGIVTAWRSRAAGTLGRAVEWGAEGRVRRGVAEDVDGDGALLVRAGGGVERVISGEVRWI
jgi:BirA family transcriptional regulator, biotin operon repressor / biotin---[acetyl-CoA-carboxylase] ligase